MCNIHFYNKKKSTLLLFRSWPGLARPGPRPGQSVPEENPEIEFPVEPSTAIAAQHTQHQPSFYERSLHPAIHFHLRSLPNA